MFTPSLFLSLLPLPPLSFFAHLPFLYSSTTTSVLRHRVLGIFPPTCDLFLDEFSRFSSCNVVRSEPAGLAHAVDRVVSLRLTSTLCYAGSLALAAP